MNYQMDGTTLSYPEKGTPQDGVISPVISNIVLHYVLDRRYVRTVRTRLKGRGFSIRFADDFIIGCEQEEDAKRIMAVLPKRFSCFKLTIHPTKTKLIRFQRPPSGEINGTFYFLGFTHFWAKTRQGYWVIKRKTAKKRLSRAMKSLWQWRRDHRHENIFEQYKALSLKLQGHYQYYGIRSNFKMLEVVMEYAENAWRHWLGRRSRESYISWELFERLRRIFPLPKPRICHAI